jgi:hypothetical protein
MWPSFLNSWQRAVTIKMMVEGAADNCGPDLDFN